MADDEKITKRRVTMVSLIAGPPDDQGVVTVNEHRAVDYVPDDERDGVNVLQAYLEQARQVWQRVDVSDELDAGPGGYHGQTVIPGNVELITPEGQDNIVVPMNHPAAGRVYKATKPGKA